MKRTICAAQAVCEANGWGFDETFPFQFRLSKSRTSPSENWMHFRLGDWNLHHCPRLPRHELVFGSGRTVGVVLGVAVDQEGACLNGRVVLEGKGTIDALETYIEGLAGRFIAVVAAFGTKRVYFDPSGGLSAVYSNKDKAVASSVHLAVNREIEPLTTVSAKDVQARKAQFALGETCDIHCRRIYANHYLDLADFELKRHWLGAEDDFETAGEDRNGLAERITGRLGQVMAALAGGYSTTLPISGGTDSRLLLAAATPVLDRIERFFMHDIRWITQFDRKVAVALAQEVGVKLEVVDRDDPEFERCLTDDQVATLRDVMALRTSLAFNGINKATVRAVEMAPATELVLRGNGAEMTRANKWTRETAVTGCSIDDGLAALLNMRAKDLSDRLAPDRLESLRERYGAWCDGLPEPARARLPDMAHSEVFMPSAPNNVYYAFAPSFYVNPFNDRRMFFDTAAFHPRARRRRRLVGKMIELSKPCLNQIPYKDDALQQFRQSA